MLLWLSWEPFCIQKKQEVDFFAVMTFSLSSSAGVFTHDIVTDVCFLRITQLVSWKNQTTLGADRGRGEMGSPRRAGGRKLYCVESLVPKVPRYWRYIAYYVLQLCRSLQKKSKNAFWQLCVKQYGVWRRKGLIQTTPTPTGNESPRSACQ